MVKSGGKAGSKLDETIVRLFSRQENLSFGDIRRGVGTRSNKLAYHLSKLVADGTLIKVESAYALADNHRRLIPYMSDEPAAMPVVLVQVGNSRAALLVRREKRPYKGMLGLPGGRLRVGESVFDAARRIVRSRCGVQAEPTHVSRIIHEHAVSGEQIMHSFLLIVVMAGMAGTKRLTSVPGHKQDIIPSDYAILSGKRGTVDIPVVYTQDSRLDRNMPRKKEK